ncbi:DNA polymerase Y family protein [Streptomyces sp. NBC_00162]|uniref:DNA polymerase Y family protein n=1 Tax=Streptomyces sp. NBC_00162 TaxID=2903629 RepID=UPI00214AB1A7|nr:hypothetical protein [Streptomyces sp. NBC_00162]UUU37814.1 hypothetical protein JIW86_02215 [Streptomyces sp. NBC_00162]
MAAAATPPGATTMLEARNVQAWLRPRPAAALHQVGPATANKLRTYGLHTIGDIADAPVPTLVCLFGASTGRSLHAHAHAHGQDLRTVQTQPAPKSMSAERTFDHDVLDPAEHRRTLLDLTDELGARLRDEQQATGNLTISVRYTDRTGSTRSRTLPEPTAHTRPLTTTAYELYDLLGLQRARVRAISLRAQDLRPATEATQPSKPSATATAPATAPAPSGPPPSPQPATGPLAENPTIKRCWQPAVSRSRPTDPMHLMAYWIRSVCV